MKYLFGVFAMLVFAVVAVAAQQNPPPKQAPSIQPTAEALMKAQSAADKSQAKNDQPFAEELKQLVEREIAKSAALPVTTTMQQPVKQTLPLAPELSNDTQFKMIVIDGVVYVRVGNSVLPMAGSGCFLTQEEIDVKTQRAQAKFAEMNKAEPVKK
ncbi:MAG: hypothetical protein JST85_19610 [Acidobacteria bacterium]|nr:hypothetical protein [Acidobacteriota bacterium]